MNIPKNFNSDLKLILLGCLFSESFRPKRIKWIVLK